MEELRAAQDQDYADAVKWILKEPARRGKAPTALTVWPDEHRVVLDRKKRYAVLAENRPDPAGAKESAADLQPADDAEYEKAFKWVGPNPPFGRVAAAIAHWRDTFKISLDKSEMSRGVQALTQRSLSLEAHPAASAFRP